MFRNDFVELFNRSSASVSIEGWTNSVRLVHRFLLGSHSPNGIYPTGAVLLGCVERFDGRNS